MNDNSTDQDRYLALARDAVADELKDPKAQATMRQIGGGYLAMARLAEKRGRTAPAYPPHPRLNPG